MWLLVEIGGDHDAHERWNTQWHGTCWSVGNSGGHTVELCPSGTANLHLSPLWRESMYAAAIDYASSRLPLVGDG